MPITLSAVFEDADTADFALAELSRNGLAVRSFKSQLPFFSGIRDAQSEEVIATMTVDDSQAATAQAMLVSAGGRQVKPVAR